AADSVRHEGQPDRLDAPGVPRDSFAILTPPPMKQVESSGRFDDVNAVIAGYLRDLAFAQATPQKMYGYKRAANAIFGLERSVAEVVCGNGGALPKIVGIGPASARVSHEVLETGGAPSVEQAIDKSGQRMDSERRRALRTNV